MIVKRGLIAGSMICLLLLGAGLVLVPGQTEGAYDGSVIINADGSITPSDAPIQVNKNSYRLTDDINGGITIMMDDISLNGMGNMISGSGSGFGIYLNGRSGVDIKNCHVSGFAVGIRLEYSSNNVIKDNLVTGNAMAGIAFWYYSSENTVKNNEITGNTYGMVLLWYSDGNMIKNNLVHKNTYYGFRTYAYSNGNEFRNNQVLFHNQDGIQFDYCYDNIARNNLIDGAGQYGIFMRGFGRHLAIENTVRNIGFVGILAMSTSDVSIRSNEVYQNFLGIATWYSSENSILGNSIYNNDRPGINVEDSTDILVKGNEVTGCKHGIFLVSHSSDDTGNMIIENTFEENMYGIYIELGTTNGNTFHHNNIIDNTYQLYTDSAGNVWDDGSEGNYWSDYSGEDNDNDGVGDTMLPHQGVDNYPLMYQC